MNQGRRKAVRRTAAVVASMALVGLVWSGVATAEVQARSRRPTVLDVR